MVQTFACDHFRAAFFTPLCEKGVGMLKGERIERYMWGNLLVNLWLEESGFLCVCFIQFCFIFQKQWNKICISSQHLSCYYFASFLARVSGPLVNISSLRLDRVVEYCWTFQEKFSPPLQIQEKRCQIFVGELPKQAVLIGKSIWVSSHLTTPVTPHNPTLTQMGLSD